jgi:hypothetical protein
MKITRKSTLTGIERTRTIAIEAKRLAEWKMGYGPLEELAPEVSDEDREFIISGIIPDEWTAAFLPERNDIFLVDEL